MPPSLPENALIQLLRQCYHRPGCRAATRLTNSKPASYTRYIRTSSVLQRPDRPDGDKPIQNVAVVGGGITGLASAFYLSQRLPTANITLYEGSERLGGWLRTNHVNVANGQAVFEQGPRTLRPSTAAGLVVLNMIKKLGIEDEVLITDKESEAARNRFVYYPDRLVRMPSPGANLYDQVWSVLTEPIYKGLFTSLLFEDRQPKRPDDLEDESVGSFMTRRLGRPEVPDNIMSAVLHGIYAGDINQLSVKSLLPVLWHNEGKYGSLTAAAFQGFKQNGTTMTYRDAELMREMYENPDGLARASEMTRASVYSFKKGIGQLTETLSNYLRANKNVTIKTSSKLSQIAYSKEHHDVMVTTEVNQPPKHYDHVISTISGKTLATLLPKEDHGLANLAKTHSVTVMVVNLYYSTPNLLPVHGFGYLIPRSIPYAQNPEFALGVVFDSDASIGQDTAAGTKLTVMMGGHWWDSISEYPDEEQGARMAKAVLKRHLNIDIEPEYVHVGIQKNCIPQYTVGHEKRMKAAHMELFSSFKGCLSLAGNSYTGVGLNDCVRAARDVVHELVENKSASGLTSFCSEKKWVVANFTKVR